MSGFVVHGGLKGTFFLAELLTVSLCCIANHGLIYTTNTQSVFVCM